MTKELYKRIIKAWAWDMFRATNLTVDKGTLFIIVPEHKYVKRYGIRLGDGGSFLYFGDEFGRNWVLKWWETLSHHEQVSLILGET